jgi:hypothetical protein
MKRFAPLALLLVLACTGDPTAPASTSVPSAALTRDKEGTIIPADERLQYVSEHKVGPTWYWTIAGQFGEGGQAVRVKVYFMYPDGTQKLLATGTAEPRDGALHYLVDSIAPHIIVADLPEQWRPQFIVEVGTAGGYFGFHAYPLAVNAPGHRGHLTR